CAPTSTVSTTHSRTRETNESDCPCSTRPRPTSTTSGYAARCWTYSTVSTSARPFPHRAGPSTAQAAPCSITVLCSTWSSSTNTCTTKPCSQPTSCAGEPLSCWRRSTPSHC